MTFNAEAATARYVDSLGADNLRKAAEYTQGNHWLLLWGMIVAAAVTWLIVRSKILDRLDGKLERRGASLRAFLISGTYLLVAAVIEAPWTVYAGWWRERSYGRTSQPLGDFLFQSALSTLITLAFAALFMIGVYALIRRAGKRWWIWSGALTAVAVAFILLISPVLIEPLFNKYRAVPSGPVQDALVEMAAKADIPADRIFMFDGSRQSNNFTANVSGIGGSARIAISDVAMKQASLDEVRAVTGHEIGHYVLAHVWFGVVVFSLLAVVLFFLADRLYPRFARWFGSSAAIGDPRGVPVLLFMVNLFGLLAMPVVNTLGRTIETQADSYSLRTENRPDALATALVKTAEYRYPRPGLAEEIIFYDHPSVERRVRTAMEYKAAHPPAAAQPAAAGQ